MNYELLCFALIVVLTLAVVPTAVVSQDSTEGSVPVQVIVRVVDEDGNEISGARVVIRKIDGQQQAGNELAKRPEPRHGNMEGQDTTDENGIASGSTGTTRAPGRVHVTVHACGKKVDVSFSGSKYTNESGAIKPQTNAENLINQVKSALTQSPAPSTPISGSLATISLVKWIAYGVVVVDCDGEKTDPTEGDTETEDVDISVDSEFDDGWTYDARDYDIDVKNKREDDMTDFKICIPDKDDNLLPSAGTQDDAEDVVEPEDGGIPDGWEYYYTDKDGDGDNDCLYFYTDGDNYQPVKQGETGSFGVTTGYDGKGNIGMVQYIPSYWDGSKHKEGEATEGFGPVPFAMNFEGHKRALRTGAGNAEITMASVRPPGIRERIEEWKSDIEDSYNPAVENGNVPGFVSSVIERRMLVNLRESGRYIAVRTELNGAVSSIELVSDKEAKEFNQQITVTTDAETVEAIRTSKNSPEAAQSALKNGDVRLYGENIGASWKTRAATAGTKVIGGGGAEEIYGEETVKESELGYRYVETPNKTDTGSGMNIKTVVDRNGGVRGVTTEGCQELIEAGGTEGLSENAGVYGSRERWERRKVKKRQS